MPALIEVLLERGYSDRDLKKILGEKYAACDSRSHRQVKDDIGMPITSERVFKSFNGLETGNGAAFFEYVADDVDWTVMGTHPMAEHHLSKKTFMEGTFAKLSQVLPGGAQLHVEHLIVKGDQATVELHSLATAKNGMRFDSRHCWVVCFHDGSIVKVRAYLDSAMVVQLFEENPIQSKEGAIL
jgi:uncharacterized protein